MMLRKLGILGVLFGMLLSVQAMGNNQYAYSYQQQNCCEDDCWCSGWAVYADWLYWRARRCQLDYAVRLNELEGADPFRVPSGNLKQIEPCYTSGYRIGVLKECDCLFFDLSYTHFNDREKDHIGPVFVASGLGGLASTLIPPNLIDNIDLPVDTAVTVSTAEAKLKLDYDVVDILGGYTINPCCCFQTFVFGGLKLAFIDQDFDAQYEGTVFQGTVEDPYRINIEQKVDVDAYGIELGFGFDYSFCGCFNFFTNFSYDVLLGNFTRSTSQSLNLNDTTIPYVNDVKENCWAPLTVANLKFGLGYDFHFCDCCIQNVFFAIGYEFHQWMNMLSFLKVDSAGFIQSADSRAFMSFDQHLQNFGVDGLFIRMGIGF